MPITDYQNEYLTLSALEDGEITITIPAAVDQGYASYLSYSKDKLEWAKTDIDDTNQTITILATDISAEGCLEDWVDGVAPAGSFTKTAPMTLWSIGASGVPN